MNRKIVLTLIKGYQLFSKWTPPVCRFYPSCSTYGYQAVERYGVLKGLWLILLRLSKCHPFHPGGYDPLPCYQKKQNKIKAINN